MKLLAFVSEMKQWTIFLSDLWRPRSQLPPHYLWQVYTFLWRDKKKLHATRFNGKKDKYSYADGGLLTIHGWIWAEHQKHKTNTATDKQRWGASEGKMEIGRVCVCAREREWQRERKIMFKTAFFSIMCKRMVLFWRVAVWLGAIPYQHRCDSFIHLLCNMSRSHNILEQPEEPQYIHIRHPSKDIKCGARGTSHFQLGALLLFNPMRFE